MLPKKAVEEFIVIYKKESGIKLPFEVAVVVAQRFFEGMSVLFEPKDIDQAKEECKNE